MHIQRHRHTSTHVQSAHKRNGDNQAQEPGWEGRNKEFVRDIAHKHQTKKNQKKPIFTNVVRVWSVHSVLDFSAIKKNLEDHIRHRESILDHSIAYGFSRVLIFYPEWLQSCQKPVCMEWASYSHCKVGLRGFPAALLSVAEMVDEA